MPKPKVPKMLSLKDDRIKRSDSTRAKEDRLKRARDLKKRNQNQIKKTTLGQPIQHQQQLSSTAMFFNYNQQLGPPFLILCDTNFINFSIKNKLDIKQGMMDCLLAKCVPMVTDCVVAELQKLGAKYRVALRMVHQNFERLPCAHKGKQICSRITNAMIAIY